MNKVILKQTEQTLKIEVSLTGRTVLLMLIFNFSKYSCFCSFWKAVTCFKFSKAISETFTKSQDLKNNVYFNT